MKFEELLEKKEAKQLTLLKKLVLAGGKMPVADMAAFLAISKPSLEKYVEELGDLLLPYEGDCQLTYQEAFLVIEMAPSFSLNMIESRLYKESLKFEILEYLLLYRDFSTISLAQRLAISESSLSRKIKELNQLLREFDLMIWQGKIEGEESQIRYFYFQLLWYLNNLSEPNFVSDRKVTGALERGLGLHFSEIARQRADLWIKITKYRLGVSNLVYEDLREKMVPYLKDHLYRKMREIVYRMLGHYALEIREEEAMLHFAFLTGMSIFSEADFHEYALQRSRFTPAALADTLILEHMLLFYRPVKIPRPIEASTYYHLAQIHTRLYFFKGDVEVFDRANIWQLEERLSSRNMRAFSQQLLALALPELKVPQDASDSLLAMTEVKYLSVLAILDVHVNREVQVGIALKMEGLFQEAVVNMWILYLKNINGVVVETYQEGKNYDLVITNYSIFTENPIYRITELGTNYDISMIKKLIRQQSDQYSVNNF